MSGPNMFVVTEQDSSKNSTLTTSTGAAPGEGRRDGVQRARRGREMDWLVVDNFAGGGGASTGIERALGRPADYAINHDPAALAVHRLNHPGTEHICEDVFTVDARRLCGNRPVGLAWFSPDCAHFSKAKGGKPRLRKIRGLAWVAVKWAEQVRPRVIMLENVEEFKGWGPLLPDGRPDPKRRGLTFRRWLGRLRKLGYQVDWRELVAANYGAPTTRKRLFIVARRDGEAIEWPEPTHGDPRLLAGGDLFGERLPWRAAAECIDWSLACPSIFERKRPLAENTLRRIAAGVRRFVLEAAEPFIVPVTRGEGSARGRALSAPIWTITAAHRGELALVEPSMIGVRGRAGQSAPRSAGMPMGTTTAKADCALVAASMMANTTKNGPRAPTQPLKTITTGHHHFLTAAFLAQHYGQSIGQDSKRALGAVTGINHHSVVLAFLNKYRGACSGADAQRPMPTITAGGGSARPAGAAHALGLTTAFLSKFYGAAVGSDLRPPMPAATSGAGGGHIAEVRAFLLKYYGTGVGQDLRQPLHTVTSRHRLGLVTVAGVDFQIVDIGLRMLDPAELMLAQGFPGDYRLEGSKAARVALIGNSVCPAVAEALVRANCRDLVAAAAA